MTTTTTASERSLALHYATFSAGQVYAGHHVEISAVDRHCAIYCMILTHGSQWSGDVYSPDDFRRYLSRNKSKRLARITQRPGSKPDGSAIFEADRRN